VDEGKFVSTGYSAIIIVIMVNPLAGIWSNIALD
jgi:hypothetical protein